MTDAQCRWGILGASGIARKNWQSIRNSGNGTLVAVASRKASKAADWIAGCQAHVPFETPPEAVEGYDALLKRKDVDAVYIPLPTGVRKEWVVRAAQAGKHVLCEKPCGVDVAEVEEMLAACAKAGVQFMDGVMFMHSDRLREIRRVLDDGSSIGEVRRIGNQFSFMAPEEFLKGNIRMSSALEPLGSLGDLGWYTIRFALWVMKYAMPRKVSGRILNAAARPDSPAPVPMDFSGELFFDGGVTAGFFTSFRAEHQQWATVAGTKGNLRMHDFVLPYFGNEAAFTVANGFFEQTVCDFNFERRDRRIAVPEFSNSHGTSQETKLFRTFAALARGGKPDPHWGEIALKTQKVMMACFESGRRDGALVDVK